MLVWVDGKNAPRKPVLIQLDEWLLACSIAESERVARRFRKKSSQPDPTLAMSDQDIVNWVFVFAQKAPPEPKPPQPKPEPMVWTHVAGPNDPIARWETN